MKACTVTHPLDLINSGAEVGGLRQSYRDDTTSDAVVTRTIQEHIKALESQHALQISSARNISLPKKKPQ